MEINVNGKRQSISGPVSIKDYVMLSGLVPEHIVIEVNKDIVKKDLWEKTQIQPDDSLEIVHFVGGG